MVVVPAGSFEMGSPETEKGRDGTEGPRHTVTIAKAFAAGKFEVTRAQYAAFARATKRAPSAKSCGYRNTLQGAFKHDQAGVDWEHPGFEQKDNHPVVCVNWSDAKAYVEWLAQKTSRPYRLLTDAEWEYAARAGKSTSRPWGDDPAEACKHANVGDIARDARLAPGATPGAGTHACDDRFATTAPVGSFAPNPFGLHDVIGNVWEWVEDCWNKTMDHAPAGGTAWLTGDCKLRTVRGTSWLGPAPGGVRLAKRSQAPMIDPYINLGIRVALTLPDAAAKPKR